MSAQTVSAKKRAKWLGIVKDRNQEPPPVEDGKRFLALTKGLWAKVDEASYAEASKHLWYAYVKGSLRYAVTSVGRKQVFLHRFVVNAPAGTSVDHLDGDGLNCSISNIRVASQRQNTRNRRKTTCSKSPYKGAHPVRGRWRAIIAYEDKKLHVGYFDSAREAALAYDSAARQLHGAFACVNFPLPGERGCL